MGLGLAPTLGRAELRNQCPWGQVVSAALSLSPCPLERSACECWAAWTPWKGTQSPGPGMRGCDTGLWKGSLSTLGTLLIKISQWSRTAEGRSRRPHLCLLRPVPLPGLPPVHLQRVRRFCALQRAAQPRTPLLILSRRAALLWGLFVLDKINVESRTDVADGPDGAASVCRMKREWLRTAKPKGILCPQRGKTLLVSACSRGPECFPLLWASVPGKFSGGRQSWSCRLGRAGASLGR